CGYRSTITVAVASGTTYRLRLTGLADSQFGPYTLAWTFRAPVRATFIVTLTNDRESAGWCKVVVKTSGLAPNQTILISSGGGEAFDVITEIDDVGRYSRVYGAWGPYWRKGVATLSASAILAADEVTVVTPKLTDRCTAQ
ncbi:MAG: hypothetical protein RL338_1078, partial [Chloroflexota bacterium]